MCTFLFTGNRRTKGVILWQSKEIYCKKLSKLKYSKAIKILKLFISYNYYQNNICFDVKMSNVGSLSIKSNYFTYATCRSILNLKAV